MPAVGDAVAIVGIGETPVGKLPGLHSVQIQAMAVLDALRDSGLRLADLDGIINLDPYTEPNSMFGVTLSEYLGLRPSFVSTVDVGGTVSGMTMLQQGIWAIESGYANVVACVYGENMLTGRPTGFQGLVMKNLLGGEEWEAPFGCEGMVIPYALLAQLYCSTYGAGPADLGAVAVTTRQHALLNDNAQMKKPLTYEDYLASRMISTPLRLLDCSLVSDGGGAIILARRSGQPRAVSVRSMAMRATHNCTAQLPEIGDFGMTRAGAEAYERAGIGPSDIDVALLHDAFTISVLVTLEALGFCAEGEAGPYVRSGATGLGGRLPVNPHGGLLSQAHIGGMLHITEAVRQVRGEAGRRQVPGARLALVSGNGGIFSVCGVMVLEGGVA
jgi:acetyl-CoA acetyltransferase